MPERVVVTFRGAANVDVDGGLTYLQRATSIRQRFEAIGAALCAWGPQTFSFDLAPRDLEAAIGLAAVIACEEERELRRFRAGIAHGPMNPVERGGALETLSWGAPLFAAQTLARMARAGEVLVHPKLVASRPGEMLLQGTRVMEAGGRKVRGARLDVKHPWRKIVARSVAQLREPPLLGRDVVVRDLAVPPGSVGVLRADPGAGGTRILRELSTRLSPSRALFIAPFGASREPLGAVRRALSRASSLQSGVALPDHLKEALKRLLAGDGADRWAAAELLDAWLAPSDGRFGVLTIDDAAALDVTSLEVIATSISVSGSFRTILRLGEADPIPAPLQVAPIRATATAEMLDATQSDLLTASFVGGAISPEALRRWARRSAGSPLGVREALAEGMTSGDLCMIDGIASPRRRSSGRGGEGTPRRWIERRMAYLSEGERAALLALATLGGDASDTMIDSLAVGMGGPSAHSAVVVESLLGGGWVLRPEPGWLKLTSRTAQAALLAPLGEDARRQWNLAAAGMLRHYGGNLGHADAAFFAAQGGDNGSAAELALVAARAAEAASLDTAAALLQQFAREIQPKGDTSQMPDSVRQSLTESLFPPASDGSSEPIDISADAEDDTSVDLPLSAEEALPLPLVTRVSQAPPPLPPMPPPGEQPSLELDLEDDALSPADALPSVDLKPAKAVATSTEAAIAAIDQMPGHLAELAKRALVQGDLDTLERLIDQLRQTGEHSDLAERMSSFVALGRGAKAEALRKLQAASEVELPPGQRARALLAYGVALAATGHHEGALLEALLALARAREAGDPYGEEACARFLARLSSATGHSNAAVAWATVVKRVSPASRG